MGVLSSPVFDWQGFPDIGEYIDKYNARLNVEDDGYGNTN
jgi:hypothetical protein|tara:strand:- start:6046 stop:6165 length:120 start_codon:yes stop_codon:yes gene_type:complete